MTLHPLKRLAFAVVVALGAGVGLSGCDAIQGLAGLPAPECDRSNPINIGFVVGHRANAPAPQFVQGVSELVNEAILSNGDYVTVVSDGLPYKYDFNYLGSNATDDSLCATDHHEAPAQIEASVLAAPAKTDEADILGALALAARSIDGYEGTNELIVIDSGLQTVRPIDLAEGKALYGQSADRLVANITVPPELAGKTVYWSGMGDTMPPQAPLTFDARDRLIALWRALLEKAGAELVLITEPLQPTDPQVGTTVSTVDVEVVPGLPQPISLTDDSVAFKVDSAVFADKERANQVLKDIAGRITADPGAGTITVTGLSANYDTIDAQIKNSTDRANAVVQKLIEFGVPASQLIAVGLGSNWPCYDPNNEDASRRVVLTGPLQSVGDVCGAG